MDAAAKRKLRKGGGKKRKAPHETRPKPPKGKVPTDPGEKINRKKKGRNLKPVGDDAEGKKKVALHTTIISRERGREKKLIQETKKGRGHRRES